MGNRAVITTSKDFSGHGVGVYLHWYGGRGSVEAFLEYCRLSRFRSPDKDFYGWARLCQVVANFFGNDGLSVGIDVIDRLDCDNGDNGTYIIEDWKIVDRKFFTKEEQSSYDLKEMMTAIDERQPEDSRLGRDFILADVVSTENLEPGHTVFLPEINGYGCYTVVGIGLNRVVDGQIVKGVPYVNRYVAFGTNRFGDNISNYLFDKEYRIKKTQRQTNPPKEQFPDAPLYGRI